MHFFKWHQGYLSLVLKINHVFKTQHDVKNLSVHLCALILIEQSFNDGID